MLNILFLYGPFQDFIMIYSSNLFKITLSSYVFILNLPSKNIFYIPIYS